MLDDSSGFWSPNGEALNFYERMLLHSWCAAAALVTLENSVSTFLIINCFPAAITFIRN